MAVQGRATGNAYRGVAVHARSAGRRAARGRARAARAAARLPGSARRRATPSPAPGAAAGTARHNHCTLSGTRAGRSAAGRVDSAVGGAAPGAARRRGAARPRRTPAVVTSSARRRRGARGWSRGTHSWRGWPTPAHSPIRPPPSTRRVDPADDLAAKRVVTDAH